MCTYTYIRRCHTLHPLHPLHPLWRLPCCAPSVIKVIINIQHNALRRSYLLCKFLFRHWLCIYIYIYIYMYVYKHKYKIEIPPPELVKACSSSLSPWKLRVLSFRKAGLANIKPIPGLSFSSTLYTCHSRGCLPTATLQKQLQRLQPPPLQQPAIISSLANSNHKHRGPALETEKARQNTKLCPANLWVQAPAVLRSIVRESMHACCK